MYGHRFELCKASGPSRRDPGHAETVAIKLPAHMAEDQMHDGVRLSLITAVITFYVGPCLYPGTDLTSTH